MAADMSVQASTQPVDQKPEPEREDSFNLKPSMALRISVIVVLVMTFCVHNWFMITVLLLGSDLHPIQLFEVAGSLIGIVLFPAVVVGLFQIGKRFRNPRSRYRLFLFAALYSLLSTLFVRVTSLLGQY